MGCDHRFCNADKCEIQRRADGSLSFAQAMALDPSEVEVFAYDQWEPLERGNNPSGEFLLSFLRRSKFRRSRPKRSRVQEMAESDWGAGSPAAKHSEKERTAVIRAVCEYLRTRPATDEALRRKHPDDEMAEAIEREFLEKR